MVIEKMEDTSWDFKDYNTKEGNHGLHTYPAMITPNIVKRLIEEYGNKSKTICDPFMGSGTVLVNASFCNFLNFIDRFISERA